MKQEAWRFTSVARSRRIRRAGAGADRVPTLEDIRPFLLLEAGYRLVFVDGFFQGSLSTPFFDDVQSLAHVRLPSTVRERPVLRSSVWREMPATEICRWETTWARLPGHRKERLSEREPERNRQQRPSDNRLLATDGRMSSRVRDARRTCASSKRPRRSARRS